MFIQNLDHCVPNPGILPVVSTAIVKIIRVKLTDENERPVNGFRADFCGNTLSLQSNFLRPDVLRPAFASDSGADRTQQKCRQMRVIGGFRGRLAGCSGRLGAADRWRPRRRRGNGGVKRGCGLRGLRLGAMAAVAARAPGSALTAGLAALAASVSRAFA